MRTRPRITQGEFGFSAEAFNLAKGTAQATPAPAKPEIMAEMRQRIADRAQAARPATWTAVDHDATEREQRDARKALANFVRHPGEWL